MILLVGDESSSDQETPKVPFVGTPTYKTVLDWIYRMNVNVSDVILWNQSYGDHIVYRVRRQHGGSIKIVALGKKVHEHLDSIGVQHFHLPHPSGVNRVLNDKEFVKEQLAQCGEYLNAK